MRSDHEREYSLIDTCPSPLASRDANRHDVSRSLVDLKRYDLRVSLTIFRSPALGDASSRPLRLLRRDGFAAAWSPSRLRRAESDQLVVRDLAVAVLIGTAATCRGR